MNLALAQIKALMNDEEELQPPQTEDEATPLTLEQSDNQKNGKRKKNSPESTSAPYNKQPRQERLAAPRPPNPKPSTSSGLLRTPPNTSSQEQRRPSISAEFKWTAPNTSPQEKHRPPPPTAAKFCLPLSCSFLRKQFLEPSDWFTACDR